MIFWAAAVCSAAALSYALVAAMRRRRGRLRLDIEEAVGDAGPDALEMAELPNGGARVRAAPASAVVRDGELRSAMARAGETGLGDAPPDLGDAPAGMRDAGPAPASGPHGGAGPPAEAGADGPDEREETGTAWQDEPSGLAAAPEDRIGGPSPPGGAGRSVFSVFRPPLPAEERRPVPDPGPEPPEGAEPAAAESAGAPGPSPQPEVIVVSVMAKAGARFPGGGLRRALEENGMRHGRMDIFHRHAGDDGTGPALFSAANALKPGTFDLGSMEGMDTAGVSLFLTLPAPGGGVEAFGQMLSTARRLCRALDGEMRDERREPMTERTVEHYRQRIRRFELENLGTAGRCA